MKFMIFPESQINILNGTIILMDVVRELHGKEDPKSRITDFVARRFMYEGKNFIAKHVVNRIKSCSNIDLKKTVIIGPRTLEEVNHIKKNLGYARIVLVEANLAERYKRWKDDVELLHPRSAEMTYKGFIDRNHIEYKWGLPQLLSRKNDIIVNEESIARFKGRSKCYLKKILREEDLLLGRYEMKIMLGTGQSKETWKAFDHKLKRPVALKKLIIQNGVQNLLAEAQVAAKLEHPNIARIYDIYEKEGLLSEEFVEGKNLEKLINENCMSGTLMDISDSAEIFAQLLDAVCFAHNSGRLHGDIKPANVMICTGDKVKVKLTDFEVGKIISEMARNGEQPEGGSMNYWAPELFEDHPRSKQSDLFSLGIVGYLLFTHRNPFLHYSGLIPIVDLIKSKTFKPTRVVDYNSALPQKLDEVILRLLEKNVADRYDDAEKVRKDFSSINFAEKQAQKEVVEIEK